jgi:hypothetical protein
VAHGVTTFFLPELELTVKVFHGHERVLYGGLHGNPVPIIIFPAVYRKFFQNLKKSRAAIEKIQF